MLRLKRLDDNVTLQTRYGTIETPEGAVLRLDSPTPAGAQNAHLFGDVIDGKMMLTLDAGGQRRQKEIAWGPDVRGPYAPELSLARNPIPAPAKRREVEAFCPTSTRSD